MDTKALATDLAVSAIKVAVVVVTATVVAHVATKVLDRFTKKAEAIET